MLTNHLISKASKVNSKIKLSYILTSTTMTIVCCLCLFYIVPVIKSLYAYSNIIENKIEIKHYNLEALLAAVQIGRPRKVIIPTIGVNAKIEEVGLDYNNVMYPPESPDDIAWYQLGPRPGEVGNAIIAGHYGWKGGRSAVFDNLHKLKKGDKIYVVDEFGVRTTFLVNLSKRFSPSDDANIVFTSRDLGSHLNLITCGGIWNKSLKSYSKRLVVFADKI